MERDYWQLREIETRYRLVFDAAKEAVMLVSAADFRIVEANRTAAEALNPRAPQRRSAGRKLLHEVAAKDRDAVREMLARIRERGKALSILVHLGGRRKAMDAARLADDGGAGPCISAAIHPGKQPVGTGGEEGHSTVEELIDQCPTVSSRSMKRA